MRTALLAMLLALASAPRAEAWPFRDLPEPWKPAESCRGYRLEEAIVSNDSAAPTGIWGRGEIDPEKVPFEILVHYRQTAFRPSDPIGDYVLATSARGTPRKIYWSLFRKAEEVRSFDARIDAAKSCALDFWSLPPAKPFAPEAAPVYSAFMRSPEHLQAIQSLELPPSLKAELALALHEGRLYLEGHRNPIRVAGMVRMLVQVMAEERANGNLPRSGTIHHWSREFRERYARKFAPFSFASKLLTALARGESAKHLFTGREDALLEWLVSQPFRSVAPEALFRQSFRLNRGDVYLTLLTIENILARHWLRPDRELLPQTLRLKPISNFFGRTTDTYGAWYHFFGIALYGYAEGKTKAWLVANIESLGSHILGRGEDEKQEDHVNSKGALVGALLREAVDERWDLRLKGDPTALREESYLDLGEDFRDRLLALARGWKDGQVSPGGKSYRGDEPVDPFAASVRPEEGPIAIEFRTLFEDAAR